MNQFGNSLICSYRSSRRRGFELSRLVWASCRLPGCEYCRLVRYRCRGRRCYRHDQMEVGHYPDRSWRGSGGFAV